jgi:hypothetical protein
MVQVLGILAAVTTVSWQVGAVGRTWLKLPALMNYQPLRTWCPVLFGNGVPYGIRTRVTNVKDAQI